MDLGRICLRAFHPERSTPEHPQQIHPTFTHISPRNSPQTYPEIHHPAHYQDPRKIRAARILRWHFCLKDNIGRPLSSPSPYGISPDAKRICTDFQRLWSTWNFFWHALGTLDRPNIFPAGCNIYLKTYMAACLNSI